MVINLNRLACKNRIIRYQNFKICILKAYAWAYRSTHYPWDTDYPLLPDSCQNTPCAPHPLNQGASAFISPGAMYQCSSRDLLQGSLEEHWGLDNSHNSQFPSLSLCYFTTTSAQKMKPADILCEGNTLLINTPRKTRATQVLKAASWGLGYAVLLGKKRRK